MPAQCAWAAKEQESPLHLGRTELGSSRPGSLKISDLVESHVASKRKLMAHVRAESNGITPSLQWSIGLRPPYI